MPRRPAEFITAALAAIQKASDAGDNSRLEDNLQSLIDDGVVAKYSDSESRDDHGRWSGGAADAAGESRHAMRVTHDTRNAKPLDGLHTYAANQHRNAADMWHGVGGKTGAAMEEAHRAMAAAHSEGKAGSLAAAATIEAHAGRAPRDTGEWVDSPNNEFMSERRKSAGYDLEAWWGETGDAPDWWETAAAGDDREIVALKIQVDIDKGSIEPTQRKVWGWASVTEKNGIPVVDGQQDVIESAEMQRAVHDWIMSDGPTNGIPARRMGESHLRIGIGKICDSIFFTDDIKKALNIADRVSNTGWYIGAHIDDDATWAKVESGKLRAFSIGARAFREAMA